MSLALGSSRAGLFPPMPSARSPQDAGQRLLTMLRALEKEEDDDSSSSNSCRRLEAFALDLKELVDRAHRDGLLYGADEQASSILATSSGAKRSRASMLPREASSGTGTEATGTTSDAQLIISAVSRILDSSSRKSKSYNTCWAVLVRLAADFLCAWASFIATQDSFEPRILAEYELIASNGRPLLLLLCNNSGKILLERISTGLGEDEALTPAFISCLKASAAMVSLFGTKLSRNTQLLKDLHDMGFKGLRVMDHRVVRASSALLAALPCTHNIDKATPAIAWQQAINDWTGAGFATVNAVLLSPRPSSDDSTELSKTSPLSKFMAEAIENIRVASPELTRVGLYNHLLAGICSTLSNLLKNPPASVVDSTAVLTIKVFVELAEVMIGYPVAAENAYFETRKRLRLEPIGDCIFSPMIIVNQIANEIKLQGLLLMVSLMESVEGASLAPFSENIKRIIGSSLLNATSLTVRSVIDPTSGGISIAGRERWLHLSIPLRKHAVKAFRACLVVFGIDFSGPVAQGMRSTPSLTDRGIFLVGGIVIEELALANASKSKSWGNFGEREELLVATLSCLEAAVSSGGEYMSPYLRRFVDSIAKHALQSLTAGDSVAVINITFSLAEACVLSPWPDGSLSWLVNDLHSIAQKLPISSDIGSCCTRTIQLCSAFWSPRTPALAISVPVRKEAASSIRREITLESIEDAIKKDIVRENSAPKTVDTLDLVNAKVQAPSKPIPSSKPEVVDPRPTNSRKRPNHQIASEPKVAIPTESNEQLTSGVSLPSDLAFDRGLKSMNVEHHTDDDELELPDIIDTGPDEGDEDE